MTSESPGRDRSPEAVPIQYLKGVGPQRAELMAKLGLRTALDLLYYFPRAYEDRTAIVPIARTEIGADATVHGRIIRTRMVRPRRRFGGPSRLEVFVEDATGVICATWFNAHASMLAKFPEGEEITLFGRIGFFDQIQVVSPEFSIGPSPDAARFGLILPVYPSTEGLSQNVIRGAVRKVLADFADAVEDVFPEEYLRQRNFPPLAEALRAIHFPARMADVDRARERLAYEEMFVFQTALALQRRDVKEAPGISFRVGPNVDARIRRLFGFRFTAAQERVIGEIAADMRSTRPMHRLLQGDVGCGKTAVAIYAILAALADSARRYQAALMAPTEILAEQHYLTLSDLLGDARLSIVLLRGGMKAKERREALERIRRGEVQLVVGTHALLEKDVEFENLAIVVIDEQHRFGVRQRLALKEKGAVPDVLIMTATPIPRSLSLVFFGDLDVSVIDEMPPGRRPIQTRLYPMGQWDEAFSLARREMEAGRQAYVVFPLVEESETLDLSSATTGLRDLSAGAFRGLPCALLHGQMPQEQKRQIMEDFRAGRYRCLVATTVIEVGIDVPNATVMIIQHAERLGLAQLHQLRGRVGRGPHPSHCLLLADARSPGARERLEILEGTCDGFKIAEADLRLRGPGEFFGTRQSGLPEVRLLDLSLNVRLLERARGEVQAIVASDPELVAPSHQPLRRRLLARFPQSLRHHLIG